MKSTVDSVIDICSDQSHVSSSTKEYESASNRFNSLIEKGWASKRGNQLLPESERFKNTVITNK